MFIQKSYFVLKCHTALEPPPPRSFEQIEGKLKKKIELKIVTKKQQHQHNPHSDAKFAIKINLK